MNVFVPPVVEHDTYPLIHPTPPLSIHRYIHHRAEQRGRLRKTAEKAGSKTAARFGWYHLFWKSNNPLLSIVIGLNRTAALMEPMLINRHPSEPVATCHSGPQIQTRFAILK